MIGQKLRPGKCASAQNRWRMHEARRDPANPAWTPLHDTLVVPRYMPLGRSRALGLPLGQNRTADQGPVMSGERGHSALRSSPDPGRWRCSATSSRPSPRMRRPWRYPECRSARSEGVIYCLSGVFNSSGTTTGSGIAIRMQERVQNTRDLKLGAKVPQSEAN